MNVILDYNVGNLDSVLRGLQRAGIDAVVSKDPKVIKNANSLILPGVGAFKESMDSLKASNLIPLLLEHINKGKYLLGICLGMQLLYETSYEFGEHKGLGILKGTIEKIPNTVKIPHMGWNNLTIHKQDPITKYITNDDYVYFVHSYYVKSDSNELLASTYYGDLIPAIVKKDNVYATQFHPEKSGDVGHKILKAYGEMINETISSN
jgi:glutamine amidotransferase